MGHSVKEREKKKKKKKAHSIYTRIPIRMIYIYVVIYGLDVFIYLVWAQFLFSYSCYLPLGAAASGNRDPLTTESGDPVSHRPLPFLPALYKYLASVQAP